MFSTHTKLPTGTVTFLFTDIEGSIGAWESCSEQMRAALARHDSILWEALEREGGYVFNTAGEAFCAAFPTAPQALAAALQAQRSLQSTDWSTFDIEPLQVRMALHTGFAEIQDNDYSGPPLDQVAGLLAATAGGQILLSPATQQLVRDRLPEGTDLRDLGSGEVPGLFRTEHVFQLVAPGLPADFPPLKAAGARHAEPVPAGEAAHGTNPYKGLRAFQEQDAPDFFGREALVARLVSRLGEQGAPARFLALVGPSGSGKSSVAKAGLVPAVRRGEVEGSEHWLILQMLPGSHPLEVLDALLLNVAATPNSPATLRELLRTGERGLIAAARRVLPQGEQDENAEILLVIDRFEEVFTLIKDEAERAHFLSLLCTTVTEPASRVRIVVTLRADFCDHLWLYPDLAKLIKQCAEVVLPMTTEELERAIVRPAARTGVEVEAELTASILKDAGGLPGALPLMEYALTEIFDRRAGQLLTLKAYAETGGVAGVLSGRAEEIYARFSHEEQQSARQLILRLVAPGEGNEDTRRRVRLSELASISDDPGQLDRIVEAFVQRRLLTYDHDPVTGDPTIEIAHEALIYAWPRLHAWLEAGRENLRIHGQLVDAAAQWKSSGRDANFLATGSRLSQFEGLAIDIYSPRGVAFSDQEQAYLTASLAMREEQERPERERQEREMERARQSAQAQKEAATRLRVLAAALAVLLLVAAGLVVFAFNRQAEADRRLVEAQHSAATAVATAVATAQEAQKERETALSNLAPAETQRLAAEANSLLRQNGNPETAALLSIRSLSGGYSPEGDSALMGAAAFNYAMRILDGHTGGITGVAFSPDGKELLTGSADKTARLWDSQTGKEIQRFTGHTDAITGVAFSPDGKYVLSASLDHTARLWDASTGEEIQRFVHPSEVAIAVFSPDGTQVLTSDGGEVRYWGVKTGQEIRRFDRLPTTAVVATAYSNDTNLILAAQGNTLVLLDAPTAQQLQRFNVNEPYSGAAFSPDGKIVLVNCGEALQLWDVQTGEEVRNIEDKSGSYFLAAAFSPDGKQVATAGMDTMVRLWDVQSGDQAAFFGGQPNEVQSVAFSPDGRYLIAGGVEGEARVWDVAGVAEYPSFSGQAGLVSPNRRELLTFATDNNRHTSVTLWDVNKGTEIQHFAGHTGGISQWAFSPDGRLIFTAGNDGTNRLWNAATGEELRRFALGNGVMAALFSPDGKYLATGTYMGALWLSDVGTGALVRTFAGYDDQIVSIAFSPDGERLLARDFNGVVLEWDVKSGNQIRHIPLADCGVNQFDLSPAIYGPDGKSLLATCADKTVRLLDAATGSEIRRLAGHTGAVFDIAFSNDGLFAFTAGRDHTARMWDVQSGKELRRFSADAVGAIVAYFAAGGNLVVARTADNQIRLWSGNYRQTMAYLCGRMQRDLSVDERAEYSIIDQATTCPK